MNCSRKNCEKQATKKIRFNILAKTGDDPAVAEPGAYCCDEHATTENANDLLVDNIPGRNQITRHFEQQGLALPDWTRSYAEWIDL